MMLLSALLEENGFQLDHGTATKVVFVKTNSYDKVVSFTIPRDVERGFNKYLIFHLPKTIGSAILGDKSLRQSMFRENEFGDLIDLLNIYLDDSLQECGISIESCSRDIEGFLCDMNGGIGHQWPFEDLLDDKYIGIIHVNGLRRDVTFEKIDHRVGGVRPLEHVC